jgi:hypothetical protein
MTWVTSHSEFLQNLNGTIWLQTLEREFYRIGERLPCNRVAELVAIVDTCEKAKAIRVAQRTHNEGHKTCLQRYTSSSARRTNNLHLLPRRHRCHQNYRRRTNFLLWVCYLLSHHDHVAKTNCWKAKSLLDFHHLPFHPAMSIVRPYGTLTPSTVPDTRARVPHRSYTS